LKAGGLSRSNLKPATDPTDGMIPSRDSARRVENVPWCSAAIDSLSFRSAVHPGEVVYVRACVIKVWDSSVECVTLAYAEDRNSPCPTLRLVSEAFFSLVRSLTTWPIETQDC
jgi:hypothetical protein